MTEQREPIFNLPGPVLSLIAVLVAVHLVRLYVFDLDQDIEFLATFAFVPARYTDPAAAAFFPGGAIAGAADFITYGFIHADWTHLVVNSIWMAAFGSALARRFGTGRFFLFSAVTAAGAAVAHLSSHWNEAMPMVGASGAISGHMAAAVRFVFVDKGPVGVLRRHDREAFRQPALTLWRAFSDKRALAMIVAFFAVNLLFGSIQLPIMGEDQELAWQAHIGGFVLGLLLFPLFDPIGTKQKPLEFGYRFDFPRDDGDGPNGPTQ